jgi:hypothetical protein
VPFDLKNRKIEGFSQRNISTMETIGLWVVNVYAIMHGYRRGGGVETNQEFAPPLDILGKIKIKTKERFVQNTTKFIFLMLFLSLQYYSSIPKYN